MQIPSAQLSGLKQIIYSCEPFSYSREWPPDNNSFGIWCEVLRSAAIQKKNCNDTNVFKIRAEIEEYIDVL